MKQTMPEIEKMFGLATDFFRAADEFCKKQKESTDFEQLYREELAKNYDLTSENERLTRELNTAINAGCDDYGWKDFDTEKPMDGECVVVRTNENNMYFTHYFGVSRECEVAWLRLPEWKGGKKWKQ